MAIVRLYCYIPDCDDGRKVYEPDRINLGKNFRLAVKEYSTENLEITKIRKYAGSMFNPVWVIGVYDVSSRDPTPFFIKEESVASLEEKIRISNKVVIKKNTPKVVPKESKVEIPLYIPLPK